LSEHKTDELIYFAFDLLFAGGEDLRELPLRDRKARLKPLFAKSKLPRTFRYVDHFETAGDAVLRSACLMHLESDTEFNALLDASIQSIFEASNT
jgi:bifunctional non-homologous end joining protein LigD